MIQESEDARRKRRASAAGAFHARPATTRGPPLALTLYPLVASLDGELDRQFRQFTQRTALRSWTEKPALSPEAPDKGVS